MVIVLVIAALAALGYVWWRDRQKKQKERDERTRRILETPLETFGDADASERAKRYSDPAPAAKKDSEKAPEQAAETDEEDNFNFEDLDLAERIKKYETDK